MVLFINPSPIASRGSFSKHWHNVLLPRSTAAKRPRSKRCDARLINMPAPSALRVLVLGGTGRVGTETIMALTKITPVPLSISVGGRNQVRGARICRKLAASSGLRVAAANAVHYEFAQIDINDEEALRQIIKNHDVVIHAAGPFQRKEQPTQALRASMDANVPYMDICDDLGHAVACKKLHTEAKERGYKALISTGIYPGLSNLMAAQTVRYLWKDDIEVESLKLFYHTAGTGGIGATVLASTFLILSEESVCFNPSGVRISKPAAGDPEIIDFGGKVGTRTSYLLNLPEVTSLHDCLFGEEGRTEIVAKFSTGPPIWNWLLQAMARWTPRDWMANREAMLAFSNFSLPVVRAVDVLSGARTCIQVVARGRGRGFRYSFEHEKLAGCVGEATAAFAVELIRDVYHGVDGGIGNGVLYPEELEAHVRQRILKNATRTANFFNVEEMTSEPSRDD